MVIVIQGKRYWHTLVVEALIKFILTIITLVGGGFVLGVLIAIAL